jgi:hypothetical protein
MTLDEIRKRIASIDCGDSGSAHYIEDLIWFDVLVYIAVNSTDENAQSLAYAALETRKLEFHRWHY